MTIEQIDRSINRDPDSLSKIFLKARTVEGIFIKASDFLELRKKNFWRVVNITKVSEYQDSKDLSLSRIFNGQEFVKISSKGQL